MNNSDFYVAAVTVIPLLLIAIMATRTLRPGELQRQPANTVLIFGLPVIGELAAFSFLFFTPVPTAAAAILAVVTWAGILSQLAVAVWWLAELVRREPPSSVAPAGHDVGSLAPAKVPLGSHTVPESNPDTRDEKGPSSNGHPQRALLAMARTQTRAKVKPLVHSWSGLYFL